MFGYILVFNLKIYKNKGRNKETKKQKNKENHLNIFQQNNITNII